MVRPIAMAEPWGVVRGAPWHDRHSAPATPSGIPLLVLHHSTGYVGSRQTKPGDLLAVPVMARCGDAITFRPMKMGVFDGEA
jgi:hypothetical protein